MILLNLVHTAILGIDCCSKYESKLDFVISKVNVLISVIFRPGHNSWF